MYVFLLAHAPVAIVSSFVSPPFSASWQLRSECWKDNETELREVSYWGYPELLSVSAPVFAAVIQLAAISETFFEVAQIMLDLDT